MSMLTALLFWSTITARGILNPIVVAAPAGGEAPLYLTLRNSGSDEDRLLRVTCDCAGRVEIRRMDTRNLGVDDGGRHSDVAPYVAMPPERLVELRPGANRFLRLVRLRYALVAGRTVEMTFHYQRGSETRPVRIVAHAPTGWAEGLTLTGPRHGPPRLAAMADLAGFCWRGVHTVSGRTETRCFSPAYGNFLQDRHVVGEGGESRTGWTLYSYEVMGRSTRFEVNGPGAVRAIGRVVPAGIGLAFETYAERPERGFATRAVWQRDGADAWLVREEVRRNEGWRERWRLRMVRAGPSPPL